MAAPCYALQASTKSLLVIFAPDLGCDVHAQAQRVKSYAESCRIPSRSGSLLPRPTNEPFPATGKGICCADAQSTGKVGPNNAGASGHR